MSNEHQERPDAVEKLDTAHSDGSKLPEQSAAIEPPAEGVLSAAFAAFSGPLPPPDILKAYEGVVPGAAKDMHELALERARRAMATEEKAAEAKIEDQRAVRAQFRRGQWLAFILALALISWGSACVLNGHDWAGATIVTTTLVSLVLAFLWGKRSDSRQKERTEEAHGGDQPA